MTSLDSTPEAVPAGSGTAAKLIPPAAVARLTLYLRALTTLRAEGVDRVSSESLAEASGVSSSTLRKDLSYVGSYGTRGVGYEVQYLTRNIAAALGLTHDWKVAIVGAGNLGKALARYGGFESRGFDIVAIFDADQLVVGSEVGWLRVSDVADLEPVLQRTGANMVVLALPGRGGTKRLRPGCRCRRAQRPQLRPGDAAGARGVNLRKVDMATELQILAYHAQRAQDPEEAG